MFTQVRRVVGKLMPSNPIRLEQSSEAEGTGQTPMRLLPAQHPVKTFSGFLGLEKPKLSSIIRKAHSRKSRRVGLRDISGVFVSLLHHAVLGILASLSSWSADGRRQPWDSSSFPLRWVGTWNMDCESSHFALFSSTPAVASPGPVTGSRSVLSADQPSGGGR